MEKVDFSKPLVGANTGSLYEVIATNLTLVRRRDGSDLYMAVDAKGKVIIFANTLSDKYRAVKNKPEEIVRYFYTTNTNLEPFSSYIVEKQLGEERCQEWRKMYGKDSAYTVPVHA